MLMFLTPKVSLAYDRYLLNEWAGRKQWCYLKTTMYPPSIHPSICFIHYKNESESVSHSVMSNSLWPMQCSPPGSFVHGILQARILEKLAMLFSKGSSHERRDLFPEIEPASPTLQAVLSTIHILLSTKQYCMPDILYSNHCACLVQIINLGSWNPLFSIKRETIKKSKCKNMYSWP